MREVIRIPIVHTAVELGSLSDSVKRLHVRQRGRRAWDEHVREIEKLWSRFRREIAALELDCSRVRLYQDGLPCCGRELEIVRELAERGSPNHQFLMDLVGRGAQLMGTEDPQLLIQEYEQMRRALDSAVQGLPRRRAKEASGDTGPTRQRGSQRDRSRKPASAARQGNAADAGDPILTARDRFIAARVCDTLQDGELGLVFLGAAHRIEHLLDADIHVRVLRGCLPG